MKQILVLPHKKNTLYSLQKSSKMTNGEQNVVFNFEDKVRPHAVSYCFALIFYV